MSELHDYIKNVREKHGASDKEIEQQLLSAGWDKNDIATALEKGSLPPAPKPTAHTSDSHSGPKLSSLAQAMHHILLWFFTASTTITISIVFATLFDGNNSTEALAAYVAVTLVTLTPYALFYSDFLRKFRANPAATTGKVWSIITVIFHTIGAIAATITLIINLIVGPVAQVYLAALVIGVLDIFVLTTYFTATFVNPAKRQLRRVILFAYLPVVVVLLATIGVVALSKLGPARHDEQLRGRMVETVNGIRAYYEEHSNKIPGSLADLPEDIDTDGVEYVQMNATSYQICGTFKASSKSGYYDNSTYNSDSYVSEYMFRSKKSGRQCFSFRTEPLNIYNQLNIN